MIETSILQVKVNEYKNECQKRHKEPTYKGLGERLGVSGRTISHVCTGIYKDNQRYTNKPHITRCIDNMDFEVIQNLFI